MHSASCEFTRSARALSFGYGCENAEVQHLQHTQPPPLAGEIVDGKWGDQIISLGVHLPIATPYSFRGPTAGLARVQVAIGRGGYSAIDQAAIGRGGPVERRGDRPAN